MSLAFRSLQNQSLNPAPDNTDIPIAYHINPGLQAHSYGVLDLVPMPNEETITTEASAPNQQILRMDEIYT